MHPILLHIGDSPVHSYTAMFALAFLTGTLLSIRQNFRREHPFPITTLGGIWVFIGALLGSKIYFWCQYGDWSDLKWGMFLWTGGLVFYGGLIGGIIGAVAYLRRAGAPIIPVGDLVLPYLALSHAIGRVGCFLNGCCWGSLTNLPWGVCYPKSFWGAYNQHIHEKLITKAATHSLPVHPTQLYESIGLVIIFLVLRLTYRRTQRTGLIVSLYPLLYGLLRYFNEYFRGDSNRPFFELTVSQMVAVGLMAGGLIGLIIVRVLQTKEASSVLETKAEG
jgi:phosphatidylglycerol:prolipoprotein diacylglycerol transferase